MNDDWFTQYTVTKAPDNLGQEYNEGKIEMNQQGDGDGAATLFGHMEYMDNHQKFNGSQHSQPLQDWKEVIADKANVRLQQYTNLESDMVEVVESKSPQIINPNYVTDIAVQIQKSDEEPNKFRVQQQQQDDVFHGYEYSKSDYVQQNQVQVQQEQISEQVKQQFVVQQDQDDQFGQFEQQTIGKNQSQNNVQPQQRQKEQYNQIQTVKIPQKVDTNLLVPIVEKKDELSTFIDCLTDYSPLFLQTFIS